MRTLYRTNPESFAQATESLQGRTRVYFARDEGTLLVAGNHTKPKQIPDTPYWVITNTNSGRKMLMLEGAMQSMHLPEYLIDEIRPLISLATNSMQNSLGKHLPKIQRMQIRSRCEIRKAILLLGGTY